MTDIITDKIKSLTHEFAIEILTEVNNECVEIIMKDQKINEFEARQRWEQSFWFKIISNKIKEIYI